MSAKNLNISAVYSHIKSGKFLKTYFLYGEDSHSLSEASSALYGAIKKLAASDMDCYEFSGEENSMAEVKSAASAYPFSGGLKAILFKDFEKVSDDKILEAYLKAKYDFTHLIIVNSGAVRSFEKGYLKELKKQECAFEAFKPRAGDLQEWIAGKVKQENKTINREGIQLLLELCGEEKYMIEMQLEKIITFLGDKQTITPQAILELSSVTKQFQLYDLHSAVANKNGERILSIGYNMLERGESLIGIISSLTKFFMNLLRYGELESARKSEPEMMSELGVTKNSVTNYRIARQKYTDARLMEIAKGLLHADLKLKSESPDIMMMFTYLVGVIMGGKAGNPYEEFPS